MANRTDDRWASTIVGAVIFATGMLLFIVGVHERHEARALRAHGVVTDGTVANRAAEVQIQQVGGAFSTLDVQRVTFDFEDLKGVPHSTTMSFLATDYTVGETVRLVYDSGAPEHVDVFNSCDGWLSCDRGPVLSMAIGSVMCLAATALVIADPPQRRATRWRRRMPARV